MVYLLLTRALVVRGWGWGGGGGGGGGLCPHDFKGRDRDSTRKVKEGGVELRDCSWVF